MVLRPRLIERLNEGLHYRLILISAPAGFGKTTLISEWIAGFNLKTHAAWLSLDESDRDPPRFLTYLIAALQTIAPNLGEAVLSSLQSPQPPPTETILTALLNEITALRDAFVLVLDDYHLVDAKPIGDALRFLVEHLPPQMHLVITTREDPDLPLARLRVRSQLIELRARDLRFTSGEAAEFLNQGMELGLSAEDITALEDRTEGWIAGLQLAALSLQGNPDRSGFIRAFAGDHRYILDYLVGEVLERQSQPVRNFLLQTAILDRLNGSLCTAVTDQEDGSALLEALERGNFFIVPLDDQRHWYRYHHLFAQVLRTRLMVEQPDQVTALHQRASAWYEQNDLPSDAVRHALAAQDFERAAALIERVVPAMLRSRQEATLLSWLQALPDALFRSRPVLSNHYAGALLQTGHLDGVESLLRNAERWLDRITDEDEELGMPSTEMSVVDDGAFRSLPGSIAIHRAGMALARGDVSGTMHYAHRALELIPEEDHLWHGAAAALLGLAPWTSGDIEAAYRSYADGMAHLQLAGNISDVVGGALALADIRIAQGRLREAMRVYEQALQLATEHSQPRLRGTADMHVGISELLREYGDLQGAAQHLLKSEAQGEHTGFPQYRYRWRVAMARIREAEGDLVGTLDLLQDAERLYVSDFYPNVRPVAALKVRVWVEQGRLVEALDWAREQKLSAEDELGYLREFEHITLAKVLLARSMNEDTDRSRVEATHLLERLLQAAEAGERTKSVIEILVLLALAHQTQGDIPAALALLERALMLAQPEGYVRLFVDEGAPMATLLEKAAKRGIAPNYTQQLRKVLDNAEDKLPIDPGLLDPLSERELEVLRLLGSDLTGPEIARELMVSLNTLRTHTKNIFTKLGVSNRIAAVHRADELHLL